MLQPQLNHTRRDRFGPVRQSAENRHRRTGRLTQRFPVSADGIERRSANRHATFLPPFATHEHELLSPVDILRAQAAQLADAQATRIDDLQNRRVPHINRDVEFGLGGFPSRLEFLERRGQQIVHLLHGEKLRQAFGEFRQNEILDRHGFNPPAADVKFVERAQRRKPQARRGAAQTATAE